MKNSSPIQLNIQKKHSTKARIKQYIIKGKKLRIKYQTQ
jgi:hypothetical protein